MKNTMNISVHFTMKGQNLKQDFFIPLARVLSKLRDSGVDTIVLHNAFLTKAQCEAKGFNADIPTVLNALADTVVNHSNDAFDFDKARTDLMQAMKEEDSDNTAAFIFGDIKEGVEIERDMLHGYSIPVKHVQTLYTVKVD